MPGNEVGDRVHNFFEQSSASQGQHHNPIVEGNWPGINNNQWGGNERQIGSPLNSTSKNYNLHQSVVGRGQGNQSSIGPHGMNLQESNLRSELVKSPTQLHQLNFGGFMQSSQSVHSRHNEANFLGIETESDRHTLTSRGLSILKSQQRSGSQHTNSARFGDSESPMNFNFLGGQQQMSGQQPGMMQSFPRQHSAVSDAQLMQQQGILKQMQEMQKQQQQQQFEAMQRNAMSQLSNLPNQMSGQHFLTVNDNNIMHNASNKQWQSQVMAGNTNWPQCGVSAVQGYSNGPTITPEQGHALRIIGLTTQQSSQNLYGVPVTNSRSPNPLSHSNINKADVHQQSGPASSFSGIEYASLPEKVCMQDFGTVSRSGSERNTTFEHASSQDFLNNINPGSFNQIHRRNEPISESGREDSACGSDLLPEKSGTPATSSQAAAGLDPTEAKILFGNDESIWEAFGEPSLAGTAGDSQLDSQDLLQSGRWSALMQSAVAETSSADCGMQEEWSSRPQSGNQYLSVSRENEKQPIWADSFQRASFSPRTSSNDVNATSYPSTTGLPQLSPKQATGGLEAEIQIPQEGMRWLDCSLPKQCDEQKRAFENASLKADTVFWNSRQSSFPHDNSGHPSRSAVNFIECTPESGVIASYNQDDFNAQQHNRHTHVDVGHSATMSYGSIPASNAKMGSPYASKLVLHSQSPSVHLSSGAKCQETQPTFFGQLGSNSTDMEGQLSVKMSHGATVSGIHPCYFANMSAPLIRSGEVSSSSQQGLSSENMLELLHKVDQSVEQNMASTGFAGLSQSQSSTAHGFSLQLAPPSQRAATSDAHFTSQISSRPSDSPRHMTFGNKTHARLTAVSSASGLPHSHPPSQVQSGNNRSGIVSSMDTNQWNQQQLWSAQDHSASGLRNYQSPLNGTLEAGSLTQYKKGVQDGPKVSYQGAVGGNEPQAKEPLSTGKSASESLEESTMRHQSGTSPSNSDASQKDYEESHHSLNLKNVVHDSTSMHQMQAMKSGVTDPTQRESKRLKGKSFDPDTQAAQPLSDGVNNMFSEALISQTSIPSVDGRNPSFSPQSPHLNASFQFQHGSVVSHTTPFGRNDPQKLTAGDGINRAAPGGVSSQMAPSWFEHYGTFKNGQLLTAHNVPRVPVTRNAEPLLISGNSSYNLVIQNAVQQTNSVSDTSLIGNTCHTFSLYTPTEHDSGGSVHVSMPSLPSLRPKKRKTATYNLLPWNKEIALGFKRLQNMSSAEIDWARASNRLVEKIECETGPIEDLLPIARPKKRLILTTQLMQQVFHPPSRAVLSVDASSKYEIIVYSFARLALGDVCSLICCAEGDLPVHHNTGNTSGKVNASEKIRDQYFTKFIEDLSNRSKEFETDLVRLDKTASIVDFRLDCQDMERFSVINRFAKFHGRAQVDGAHTSSFSDAPSMAHRPYLQRYVSAHPMPTAIPENVQCLSL